MKITAEDSYPISPPTSIEIYKVGESLDLQATNLCRVSSSLHAHILSGFPLGVPGNWLFTPRAPSSQYSHLCQSPHHIFNLI